ncbi:MAG TPA: DUF2877 domain-containing protein [Marmoricola sp.]|nr:DUF2877 domain-containing protein [Marmoricola sp.]
MIAAVRAPAPPLVAAAATPRLRARLAGPAREGGVVHRGRHAVYVEVDGWCVGVLADPAVAVPCGLRTTLPELGRLATAERARVERGSLWLDDTEVRVGRLVPGAVPRLGAVEPDLVALVLEAGRPAAEELRDLLDRPLPSLLGRGSGLTPLADDLLCGWLAVGFALGRPPADLPDPRRRTTLLSATLVDCARHGEVVPAFRALVGALGSGDRDAVAAGTRVVASLGHTSGPGLLLGAGLRLREEAP